MKVVRPLLIAGNDKLSENIWHFSIPAIETCPGRTKVCSSVCYATRGRFHFGAVQERLRYNYEASKRSDFASKLVDELYRKGIMVCRVHVAGDYYSPSYARKWLEIVRRSPHTQFFGYTRSYRIAKIEVVLQELAVLDNMHLWYSADAEASPKHTPRGVRVAWLQTEEGDEPDDVDLVFRVRKLRRIELPTVAPVCQQETPEGKRRGTTCATCSICWRD